MHKGRARHSNRVAWLGFVKCLRISRQCAVCSVHSFILLLIKILLSTWCVQGNIPKKMEILTVISFYCLFLKGMKKPENSQMAVQLSTQTTLEIRCLTGVWQLPHEQNSESQRWKVVSLGMAALAGPVWEKATLTTRTSGSLISGC